MYSQDASELFGYAIEIRSEKRFCMELA